MTSRNGQQTERMGRDWGRSRRQFVPRGDHADFVLAPDRHDPIALLEAGNVGRAPELIPIRFGRMAVSPFTFFRGATAVMAHDLAGTPVSGIEVQLCGDAHLSNFGLYATPERRLVFGVNDFDETLRGPWEWDVKRLAASLVVAARSIGLTPRQGERAAVVAARSYREHMETYAMMAALDVWYATVDVPSVLRLMRSIRTHTRRTADRAQQRDHLRALDRLTEPVDDTRRIRHDPPLVLRVDAEAAVLAQVDRLISRYRITLPTERRVLLARYRLADIAMKVVGVGSVGTYCWIGLLFGAAGDPLFLQVKEARTSVLEAPLGRPPQRHQGRRVLEGQRLMQAFSDVFLGWTQASDSGRDYYVRQLQDMKGSFTPEDMDADELAAYGALCAWTLARSHARSGDAPAIAGYLGASDAFDVAIGQFARAYALQNERDHGALIDAIAAGRVSALSGV
jgi:uncharacterized protein (DUF2252 family)